jgi:fructose-1,6-bisphosphatase
MILLGAYLDDLVSRGEVADDVAATMRSIADACAETARLIETAPLAGLSGLAGNRNVQGEEQKPLDIASNEIFVRHLGQVPAVAVGVSEEVDGEIEFNPGGRLGVFFDPLDGSSNLDVNVTVGSIFSVVAAAGMAEVLQPGRGQLAAGFAGYGPATTLVITFGAMVAGFVLAPEGFALTNADIKVPEGNREFAINTSREPYWDAGIKAYVAACVAGTDGKYNMRWVGSMVAEIQRILNRGGIFLYPADSETRAKGGRLRLLYEANPMALILETAGGGSSEGTKSILDIVPTSIHQRVPVILGAASEVKKVEATVRAAG